VTLSLWLRDYVYIWLGGNRAYVRNIVIVFAACGLWHGAGWNFVVWGLYHAALVLGYSATKRLWDRLPALVQVMMTFVLVSFGWLLFLFDFEKAGRLIGALMEGGGTVGVAGAGPVIMLAIAAFACFAIYPERSSENMGRTPRRAVAYTATLAGLALAALLGIETSRDFIYFRF
jgi:alginate O-acetyltransferase complex protein AlgI